MKNNLCNLIITAAVILFSSTASAGTIVCSGKVVELAYHSPNRVMIRLDSMNVAIFFCNPEAEYTVTGTTYTTGPETCKTLYSTFLAAQASGRTINSMWIDGDSVPTTCDG